MNELTVQTKEYPNGVQLRKEIFFSREAFEKRLMQLLNKGDYVAWVFEDYNYDLFQAPSSSPDNLTPVNKEEHSVKLKEVKMILTPHHDVFMTEYRDCIVCDYEFLIIYIPIKPTPYVKPAAKIPF